MTFLLSQATPTTPGTPDAFGNNNGSHSNGYYGNHGNGGSFTSGEHSSVLYVPEFCIVELSPGDIEVLQEVRVKCGNRLLPWLLVTVVTMIAEISA